MYIREDLEARSGSSPSWEQQKLVPHTHINLPILDTTHLGVPLGKGSCGSEDRAQAPFAEAPSP
jgi:hypothetical protein